MSVVISKANDLICLKFLAYHDFTKALKDVKKVVVSGGLLQVSDK